LNGTTVAGVRTGLGGLSVNQLKLPSGVLIDTNGSIFVSDTGNNLGKKGEGIHRFIELNKEQTSDS